MAESPALKPVYLLTGSDRPKIETALTRLRRHFERHLAAHHSCIHSRHGIPLTNVSPLNNRRQYLLCQYGHSIVSLYPLIVRPSSYLRGPAPV